MIVELQRDAEHIIALPLQNAGHDRAVDAARHGHDNARIFRPLVKIQCVHGGAANSKGYLYPPYPTEFWRICIATNGIDRRLLSGGGYRKDWGRVQGAVILGWW
jgi:hypothetical protein